MAIYEGEVKGKKKRDFEIVKTIEASDFYKASSSNDFYQTLVPIKSSMHDYPLKTTLRIGQSVLLYANSEEEIDMNNVRDLKNRLYKVIGLSIMVLEKSSYGVIKLRYHQEARQAKDVKSKNGAYKVGEQLRPAITLLHTQFNALVEGRDFEISVLGDIKLK